MIPLNECKDGYLYIVNARNAYLGIFNKETNGFIISRFKFGDNYLFTEYHYEASKGFGTCKPLEEVEKCPYEIYTGLEYKTQSEVLDYLNSKLTELEEHVGKYKQAWYEEVKRKRNEIK